MMLNSSESSNFLSSYSKTRREMNAILYEFLSLKRQMTLLHLKFNPFCRTDSRFLDSSFSSVVFLTNSCFACLTIERESCMSSSASLSFTLHLFSCNYSSSLLPSYFYHYFRLVVVDASLFLPPKKPSSDSLV